tara:strand:+ start:5652 stop:6593 length:942 start_codon:yes stop_codon:yes gene_type:complete
MLSIVLFILGFIALWKGGEYIVEGASAIARRFAIPEIIIGLTLVSIGTSLPELFVNVFASLKQESTIVFGNIIGSNISNTLLILGLTGMIFPFKIVKLNIKKEIYLYSLIVLITACLLYIGRTETSFQLGILAGIILLSTCVIAIYLFYQQSSNEHDDAENQPTSLTRPLLYFLAGCILLPLGGQWVVKSAIAIATVFGISKHLISLFAIAIGTSLPELVTSIIAAKKQNSSLALGNILGSNIFNLSLILGISSLISPVIVASSSTIDFAVLLYSAFLLLSLPFAIKKPFLNKLIYVILFMSYVLYILFLFIR